MGTFYRLAERYRLRGWEKLPHALVDAPTGDVAFLSKPMMETLLRCDGSWDFDSPMTPDLYRECARAFQSKGRIEPCDAGSGPAPGHRYRFFPNRFMKCVHWCITGRCNYRCKHCFMQAPDACYGELSHASVMDIAGQIASCGIPAVSLSGGEPLLRPDFMDIVSELSAGGVAVTQLHTNGALLDAEVLDGLAALGQKPDIIISFDGVGFHDWMRGVDGAEKAADAAFGLCAEKGFTARASLCVYRGNLGTLRDTVNHLASVGCASLSVGRVNEAGNWLRNDAGLTPTYEEYLDAMLRYIPQYYEDGMPLSLTLSGAFAASPDDPDRYALAPHRPGNGSGEKLLFSCARTLLQIYPDGRPAICDVLGPDFVGMSPIASDHAGAETIGLAGVLQTDSAYMKLMDTRCAALHERNAECRTCPYLQICGGGCRADAYLETGSIYGKDPRACAFFRDGWAGKLIDLLRGIRPEAASNLQDGPLLYRRDR